MQGQDGDSILGIPEFWPEMGRIFQIIVPGALLLSDPMCKALVFVTLSVVLCVVVVTCCQGY